MRRLNDHEWVMIFLATIAQALVADGRTNEDADRKTSELLEALFSLDAKKCGEESIFTRIREQMRELD
jgi:hypothetical protein